MTKLEKKHNAYRIASAPDLDALGRLAMRCWYYDKPPTFEQDETGKLLMKKPSGGITSVFVVQSGKRFYLMSPVEAV